MATPSTACIVERLLHREIAPAYGALYVEGAPTPIEASAAGLLEANQPCAVSAGAEAARHG